MSSQKHLFKVRRGHDDCRAARLSRLHRGAGQQELLHHHQGRCMPWTGAYAKRLRVTRNVKPGRSSVMERMRLCW